MSDFELAQPPAECIPDRSRLSREEDALICALAEQGKTQPQIAEIVGCHQSTVSRVLGLLLDTRAHAKRIVHSGAADIADRLMKTKHAPTMLEVLRDLEVTTKQAPAGAGKGGVTVLIGATDSQVQVSIIGDLSPTE